MKLVYLSFLAALVGAVFVSPASAELLQWTQEGQVRFYTPGFWDSSVGVGTPFSTTVIYNTSTSPSFPNGPNEAQYAAAPVVATLTVGNYNFVFNTYSPTFLPRIDVLDDYNGNDGYSWFWSTPVAQYGLGTPFTWGFLLSSDLSLLSSTDLDVKAFDTSRFDVQHNRQLIGRDPFNNPVWIDFNVDSYSVTPVPEPGTKVLFGCGVFAGFLLWKRKHIFYGRHRSRRL